MGPLFVTRTRRIRRIPYDEVVSWGYGDFVGNSVMPECCLPA